MSGNYYYEDDQKRIIRETLLDKKAQEWVEKFTTGDRNPKRRDPLTQTQLRRFFNDTIQLRKKYETQYREEQQQSDSSENEAKMLTFPRLKPHIKMLKSKVAYAFEKIPSSFENFMVESIDNIEDYHDFEAFLVQFEAVVGFSKPRLRK